MGLVFGIRVQLRTNELVLGLGLKVRLWLSQIPRQMLETVIFGEGQVFAGGEGKCRTFVQSDNRAIVVVLVCFAGGASSLFYIVTAGFTDSKKKQMSWLLTDL